MIDFFPSRTIAFAVLGWPVHWYGVLYLLAFVIAWWLLPRIQQYRSLELSKEVWGDILSWAVGGVIVGGRLGYVLFYRPTYFAAHPLDILALWQGGMSSHGGFIGVAVALAVVLRKHRLPWRDIADLITVPVAIGLALGRIGNFINQELYGVVTDLPWGISIPGVEGLRHPTQLYAVAKDLFIAVVCMLHLRHSQCVGRTMAIFLLLYGLLRFSLEFLREQQDSLVFIGSLVLSRGQILTLPLMLAGLVLWWRARCSEK